MSALKPGDKHVAAGVGRMVEEGRKELTAVETRFALSVSG